MRRQFSVFALASAALAFSSCGGGGNPPPTTSPPPGAVTPTPTAVPPQHLYVGYTANMAGPALSIAEYALPLTPQSSPILTIPGNGSIAAFAVDELRGTIAEAISTNGAPEVISFFNPPLRSTSTPYVTIPAGPATLPTLNPLPVVGMGFDPLGNLWVATSQDLREFLAPFASYSVAATIIPNGVAATSLGSFTADQPVFDQNGTMYVNAIAQASGVFTFAPPNYTAPPKRANPAFQFGPLAFDGAGNAIASFTYPALQTPGPTGTPLPRTGMGVFPLPLTSQSVPTVVFATPAPRLASSVSDAIAGVGSVYMANPTDGTLFAYTLPIHATDLPVVHTACPQQIGICGSGIQSMLLQLAP